MAKVKYTPKAVSDLEEIKEYIARDNEETARKYVAGIFDRIDTLATNPNLGISLERKWGIPTKYRMLICDSHLAFYKTEGEIVRVYRVLRGNHNYLAILELE